MTTNREVAVIDYGIGNTASVLKLLEALGVKASLTKDPIVISRATHIILPGVGAFGTGMDYLNKTRLVPLLSKLVFQEKKPFLGICLGMQLLAAKGYESGVHSGLGWIDGETVQLDTHGERLPHIGWNDITIEQDDLLFHGISDKNFYFVHSYHLRCDKKNVIATCTYGETFAAAVRNGNIFGTQFHPEKSQASGRQLIINFLEHA